MAIDGNHSKKAMTGARFVPAKLPPGRCAGLQEEGWAASPHTDFSAADLCAGANTEFGRGAPGPAPTALSPQHPAPLDGFPPPSLRLPPSPSHEGQEAAVAGSLRALLKASQARPHRRIPAEEGAAR